MRKKFYRRAHVLLVLLICFTLAIAVFILNSPQKAGTAVARTNNTTCSNNGAINISCTVTTPGQNNTLIAVIGTRGTGLDMVSSFTHTGVTWNKAVNFTNFNGITIDVWYTTTISSPGTSVTINLSTSVKASAVIAEYSGLLISSKLDKTNTTSGGFVTSPSQINLPSTGTTTTTSQSDQLWIGGMSIINSNNTFSTGNSGNFTKVGESQSTAGSASTKNTTAMYEKIVTSTGSAGTTVDSITGTPTDANWAGGIATFNAISPPTQIAFSTSSPTLTAGVCSSAITFETRDSSGAPVNATNGVVIQISATSPGASAVFYTTSDCSGSTVTSFTFNGSESSKTFYMKDYVAGTSRNLNATKISGADTLTDGNLSYNVNPGSISKLGVQLPGQGSSFASGQALGTPDNQTAGTSFIITSIVALDAYDNVATSYSGAKTLAYSGPGNAPNGATPSYTTAVSFTNGVSTTTLTTTLYKAGSTTLTVTDGGLYGSATTSFTVDAGPLVSYDVSISAGTYTAGVCSSSVGGASVTAKDSWNNTRTQDTSVVNLTSSGGSYTFYSDTSCVTSSNKLTLSSGTKNFSFKYTSSTNFSSLYITATKDGDTPSGTTFGFSVQPAAVSTILVQLPGQSFSSGTGITGSVNFTGLRTPNATAGTSFNVTLHAVDAYNNLCEWGTNEYTGAKTISWTNSTAGNAPSGTAPTYPTTAVTFSVGSSTTTLTATYVNATTSRTVRADASSPAVTGTASSAFTVQAAAVANYGVTASTPQTAGSAFNVTVTARDTYNNSLGSLFSAPAGTYTWSTTGWESPNNTAPSIGTLAQGDFTNGIATKSVTLYNAQSATFTATDPNAITGTSSSITVNAGALNNYGVFTNNGTAGTCVTTNNTVRAQDTWGNTVTGDASVVNMSSAMTGVTFYTTSACTTTTTQYTLSSGSASFYYKTDKKHSGRFTATNSFPSSLIWIATVYGDKYVSVGFSSNSAAYSTDGVTWSSSTLPVNTNWRSVTYGNGAYVAVADGSLTNAYSTNGITWSSGTLPSTSGGWRSVTYGNGKFVAIAASSNNAAYSTNGTTWTATTLPSNSSWRSVTYGDGKFVAVAAGGVAAAYSTDGINWSSASLPTSSDWSSVTYGNGKFVAVANYSYLPGSSKTAYSTNGTTWTIGTLSTSYMWSDVKYCNGKYYTVVTGSTQLGISTDGITFTNGDYLIGSNWYSIACGNNKILTTGTEITGNYISTGNSITAQKNLDTITGNSPYNIIDPAATSALVTRLPSQTFTDGTGISGASNFTGLRTPNATAGTAFQVVTHAVDAYNNLVDSGPNNYTGAKTISWTNSTAGNAPSGTAPTYPTTSVTFTNGTSTTTLTATYVNATTSRTIRADDSGTPVTGTASSTFTVQAAAVGNYGVTASTPQIAGVAFNVTVTARDNYNNALGALYSPPAGSYIWSSTASSAPDSTAPSISTLAQANFSSGIATRSVTLYKAESVTFTASEPSPSTVTGTTSSITVNPGNISANTSDSTVTGNATGYTNNPHTVTITLKDTWRNPISGVDKANITVSATGSPSITQAASNTDANGQTTAELTWSSSGTYTVSVSIGTVSLVQDNGVTADTDGFLDSTLSVSVITPPASTVIRGGTIIRGSTILR